MDVLKGHTHLLSTYLFLLIAAYRLLKGILIVLALQIQLICWLTLKKNSLLLNQLPHFKNIFSIVSLHFRDRGFGVADRG